MPENRDAPSVVLRAETARAAVERRAIGAVRVRRVIVTERRTVEIEVSREELTIERLDAPPMDATGRHRSAAEPVTLVLHAEEIEIVRRTVPYERVIVHLDQVTEATAVPVSLAREVAVIEAGTAARSVVDPLGSTADS